ncbi:hypothetical protein F4861DRAFT_150727 [Xylaria intraflava]|nr:hypothetical protein F4861DRAFT_150727 [Xylaria intraflava]
MEDSQQPEQARPDTNVVALAPKKRVITKARREQNKLAQRAYRKRQREQQMMQRLVVRPVPRRLEPRLEDTESARLSTPPSDPIHDPAHQNSSLVLSSSYSRVQGESPTSPGSGWRDLQAKGSQVALSPFSATPVTSALTSIMPSDAGVNPRGYTITTNLRNGLEDNATVIMRACLSNALCIGADMAEIMTCAKNYMSPFFRPVSQMDADAAALIAAASYDFIPDSLKPTPAQILIPHHVSIDLIPLPRLRERAIMMCTALPHLFSLWDMKLDIYTRNALVCQGSSSLGGSSCQPWDARNWHATSWFKSKWKMVVDIDEMKTSPAIPGIPGLWM